MPICCPRRRDGRGTPTVMRPRRRVNRARESGNMSTPGANHFLSRGPRPPGRLEGTVMIELLHNFWFLVFLAVIVCSVTATVAQAWQKVRRGQQETELKLEMLHRGLSVEEMERLLRCSKAHEDTDEQAVVDLVEALGGCGASAASRRSRSSDTPRTRCMVYHACPSSVWPAAMMRTMPG